MKKKRYSLYLILPLIIILLINIFAIYAYGLNVNEDDSAKYDRVYVSKVIDGDTFKTSSGTKVRLIGLDTPEISYNKKKDNEYFSQKARQFLKEKIENKYVYLDYDLELKDEYDRILAYVFLGNGEFINASLLENGYARLLAIAPNLCYLSFFREISKEAIKGQKGMWEKTPIINYTEAKQYIGKEVIIRGRVIDIYDSGDVIFINFNPEYWKSFSALIFEYTKNKFNYNPIEELENKEVLILGVIKKYKSTTEIIIDDPVQIIIME